MLCFAIFFLVFLSNFQTTTSLSIFDEIKKCKHQSCRSPRDLQLCSSQFLKRMNDERDIWTRSKHKTQKSQNNNINYIFPTIFNFTYLSQFSTILKSVKTKNDLQSMRNTVVPRKSQNDTSNTKKSEQQASIKTYFHIFSIVHKSRFHTRCNTQPSSNLLFGQLKMHEQVYKP